MFYCKLLNIASSYCTLDLIWFDFQVVFPAGSSYGWKAPGVAFGDAAQCILVVVGSLLLEYKRLILPYSAASEVFL